MPETSCQILSLHSPAGSDVAIYKWPLHVTDTWNEAHEIAETVRWACSDFPELQTAMENCILSHFDPSSYESMKLFCEKYNRAVDNIRKLWSGRQPPACIDVPPTEQHLKHILTQVYNRSIKRPEELNNYEPFSPEVYGETSFELIQEVISITRMSENDVFLDLGSGVGQIVLQVAAAVGCKCYGIEKADIPANYAESMDREFIKWMDFYGKSYGEYELLRGDFLESKFDDIINSATVIFCNNFAFGPELDLSLKLKFQNLRDGVKIVSSREFCPLNFRITERTLSDIGAIMRIAPLKGSVSWTGNPVTYYLHMIDRTQLEEFFHRQKHMAESKSEGSTTSFSDEDDDDNTSSTSTTSSSEDSSLDSNNEEELFSRPKPELFHFPPSTSTTSLYTTSHSDKLHPPAPPLQPPPRRKSITSTSSVVKKSTPPMGSTHLPHPPHPHVQSLQHKRVPSNGTTRRRGGGAGGRSQVVQRKQGRKQLIDRTALATLFDSFQKQNEAYLQQLNSAHFQSWLTDAAEKEKMKCKHLRGVIDHLESEVSSLSRETIQSMKKSMLSLGITDLTPEGLLSGAKDIVSLNRQLRKEVQLLEKEVGQLKEQNEAMNVVGSQPEKKSVAKGNETPPTSHTPPIKESAPPTTTTTKDTPPCNDTTPPTTTTTIKEEGETSNNKTTSRILVESAVKVSEKFPDLEQTSSLYEITLESIDQAVLELGPFAKDVTPTTTSANTTASPLGISTCIPYSARGGEGGSTMMDSMPVLAGSSNYILGSAMITTTSSVGTTTNNTSTKDTITKGVLPVVNTSSGSSISSGTSSSGNQRPFSPAKSDSNNVSSNSSGTKGSKKGGRRRKEETPPTWSCATPPRPSSVNSPLLSEVATPTTSETLPTYSETSAVEAMLALSRPPSHNSDSKGTLPSSVHAGTSHKTSKDVTTSHLTTPLISATPLTSQSSTRNSTDETSHTHHQKVKSYGTTTFPYSLPPLSKLPTSTDGGVVRQRTNSSSSVKSKEEHPMSSPSVYMQYDNRASPVIRATPTTTTPTSTNPFLPPSLQTDTSMVSFQYPFGWNPSLYRTNFYSTLPYPTAAHASVDSAHSLDPSLRPVISPYILRYPYPSAGNIAIPGLVSTTPSLTNLQQAQATLVSSNSPGGGGATPSHLSAFKSLHTNYNRSLTPPTLHPLATAQTLDKTTPETLTAQWPFIGQYQPSGVAFSPYTVFPGGGAGTQLTSYGSLASATALLQQATPTGTQDLTRGEEVKRSKRDTSSSSHEIFDQRLLYGRYVPPSEQQNEGALGRGVGMATPPRPNSRSSTRGGAKSEGKTTPKIKIHQMNNEDFQEKGVDRRRKRVRGSNIKDTVLVPPQAPVVMSSLPHQRGVVSSPQQQEDDTIDVTSIDPMPHPLLMDSSTPLINNAITKGDVPVISGLIKREEEEEEEIEIDVDRMTSSEGTMSASPSPPPSPSLHSTSSPHPLSSLTSTTSTALSLPSTTLPLSLATTALPLPSTALPLSLPSTALPLPLPSTALPLSLPSTALPLSSLSHTSTDNDTLQNYTTATVTSTVRQLTFSPPTNNTTADSNISTSDSTETTTVITSAGTSVAIGSTTGIIEKEGESLTVTAASNESTTTVSRPSTIFGSNSGDGGTVFTLPFNELSEQLQQDENDSSTLVRQNEKDITNEEKEKEETEDDEESSLHIHVPLLSPSSLVTTSTVSISQTPPITTPLLETTPITSSDVFTSKPETPPTTPPTFRMSLCQSTSSELVIDVGSPQTTPTQLINEEADIVEGDTINKLTNQISDNSVDISEVNEMDFEEDKSDLLSPSFNDHTPLSITDHTPLLSPVEQSWSEFQENINETVFPSLTSSSSSSPPLPLPPHSSYYTSNDYNSTTISDHDRRKRGSDQSNHFTDTTTSPNNITSPPSLPLSLPPSLPHTDTTRSSGSHHNKMKKLHKHHKSSHSSSKHKDPHTLTTAATKDTSRSYKTSSNHIAPPTSIGAKHHHTHDKLTTPTFTRHEQGGERNSERRLISSHKSNDGRSSSHRHRSPNRPRPYDNPLSPPTHRSHHTHSHHRNKRHTPTEERHHKRTSHTHHTESGRGHQCRSHSSTPVPEGTSSSGRSSDKSHTHRVRDTISPNWNSDDTERREWSHHHGDRSDRKRHGSEGSDDYKYKKMKHKHVPPPPPPSTSSYHRKQYLHHTTSTGTNNTTNSGGGDSTLL